jgi:hypothetical protein
LRVSAESACVLGTPISCALKLPPEQTKTGLARIPGYWSHDNCQMRKRASALFPERKTKGHASRRGWGTLRVREGGSEKELHGAWDNSANLLCCRPLKGARLVFAYLPSDDAGGPRGQGRGRLPLTVSTIIFHPGERAEQIPRPHGNCVKDCNGQEGFGLGMAGLRFGHERQRMWWQKQ